MRTLRPRLFACASSASAVLFAASPSLAEEAVDAPAPPTLPALTHRAPSASFELTLAQIRPADSSGIAAPGSAYAWFTHMSLEAPFVARAWYAGIAEDVADAAVPHTASAPAAHGLVLGNPELWVRGTWSSDLGLASGGVLGVVLPIPRRLDESDATILRTVRAVRPWDLAYFEDFSLTFRPSFDIRHVRGPLMLQLRQGVDWSIALRERAARDDQALVGRTTFYVGYRLAPPIGVGLELWEVYALTESLRDDRRAALAVSPHVRFMLGRIQPALSLLAPISTPLRGDVESYYALRFNVSVALDSPRSPGPR